MTIPVNKELSGQANLVALVHHTWPDLVDVLTADNVEIVGGIAIVGSTNTLGLTITAISDQVVGEKEVTYDVTDLGAQTYNVVDADDAAAAKAQVEAIVADFACLPSEITVSDATEVDGQYRVDVTAAAGAVTCAGTKLVWVPITFVPLDLETDLPETELDGFEQIAQQ